jgi:glycosyltransferase involved in cell wall biosynthesis
VLNSITPVVLTFNEAPNISRVLDRLSWATEIVVVDSGSHDGTQDIVSQYQSTRLVEHEFDDHASQWNFVLNEIDIPGDWILALDADHVMTGELVSEISKLTPGERVSGFRISFTYCALGQPLRGSLYPPLVSLYRRDRVYYFQQGHTHRLAIDGEVIALQSHMLHDDRKSFGRWVESQHRYMRLEADLIKESTWSELSWPNRLRMFVLPAPIVALFWCLVVKMAILDGFPGIYYSVQRMIAESILSFHLLVQPRR